MFINFLLFCKGKISYSLGGSVFAGEGGGGVNEELERAFVSRNI